MNNLESAYMAENQRFPKILASPSAFAKCQGSWPPSFLNVFSTKSFPNLFPVRSRDLFGFTARFSFTNLRLEASIAAHAFAASSFTNAQ